MGVMKFLVPLALGWALTTGNAMAQQRIEGSFNLDETIESCAGCHGDHSVHGVPVSGEIPILWGQQFYYLYVQLKDFKAGRRANETMEAIAAEFDKGQMKALAQYFADKPWPDVPAEAPTADPGHVARLIDEGQCSACHNTFMGDSRLPRVAGQQYEYLIKTLIELRDNVRQNAAAMQALMRTYSDQDLEDLARYMAAK